MSAAAFNLDAVHNQLVFRVAEAYYRLLQARDLVQVRREAVEQVEQHLKIVESRFRNETAVKSDVLTVQVRLAEVREALISAENQLELAWAVLQNVTGTRIEQQPLPAAIPAAPWGDHVDETEVAVAEALGMRPELGALASQRQAAAEGVQVAEAGKRMSVDLVADYDVYTGDFRTGNDSFFAGLVFQLNLFDGGRTSDGCPSCDGSRPGNRSPPATTGAGHRIGCSPRVSAAERCQRAAEGDDRRRLIRRKRVCEKSRFATAARRRRSPNWSTPKLHFPTHACVAPTPSPMIEIARASLQRASAGYGCRSAVARSFTPVVGGNMQLARSCSLSA